MQKDTHLLWLKERCETIHEKMDSFSLTKGRDRDFFKQWQEMASDDPKSFEVFFVTRKSLKQAQSVPFDWLSTWTDISVHIKHFDFPKGKSSFPTHLLLLLPIISFCQNKVSSHRKFNDLTYSNVLISLSESWHILFINFLDKALRIDFASFKEIYQPKDTFSEYASFIKNGGLEKLEKRWPMLCRIISQICHNAYTSIGELMDRWELDQKTVFEKLNIESDKINALHVLGDTHVNGVVMSITFKNQKQLIYKPRSVDGEKAYFELTKILLETPPAFNLKAPLVVDFSSHGYVEFIKSKECQRESDIASYYHSSGVLLAILYVLGATDIHLENLVAKSKDPVLIDSETICHPSIPDLQYKDEIWAPKHVNTQQLSRSIISIGILPEWKKFNQKEIKALGALKSINSKPSLTIPGETETFNKETHTYTTTHIPKFNDHFYYANDFTQSIIDGFIKCYDFFVQRQNDQKFRDRVLRIFSQLEMRYIHHDTIMYDRILTSACHPKRLVSGIQWSMTFEYLARSFVDHLQPESDGYRMMMKYFIEEVDQLTKLTIPYFRRNTSDSTNFTPMSVPSTVNDIETKWGKLNDIDKERQLVYIRSLLSNTPIQSQKYPFADPEIVSFDLRNRISHLGEQLITSAQRNTHGISWVGALPLGDAEYYNIGVLNSDIYSGLVGISLFSSILYKYLHEDKYLEMAYSSFAVGRKIITDKRLINFKIRSFGVGFDQGVAGLLYALAAQSVLLNDQSILDDCIIGIDHLKTYNTSTNSDPFSGWPGLIIILCEIGKLKREPSIDQIINQLLNNREKKKMLKDARLQEKTTITDLGITHGLSGDLMMYLKLYEYTLAPEYLNEIKKRVRLIMKRIVLSHESLLNITWCNGLAGIGTALSACYPFLEEAETRFLAQLKDKLLEKTLLNNDHICCGNFGVLAFLADYALKYDDMELYRQAKNIALRIFRRASENNSFNLPFGNDNLNPGFFTGISGVGYYGLKTIERIDCPNILSFSLMG